MVTVTFNRVDGEAPVPIEVGLEGFIVENITSRCWNTGKGEPSPVVARELVLLQCDYPLSTDGVYQVAGDDIFSISGGSREWEVRKVAAELGVPVRYQITLRQLGLG